jgi:flavin reductase (DIM6/NTAB) family NADH-FMN oxidoreductase RutF
MRGAAAIAVNFLAPDQSDMSSAFARPSADRVDLWRDIRWRPDASGVPLLEGAVGAFSAKTRELVDAGDHTLVLADVTAIHFGDAYESLVYHNRGYGRVQRH